MRFRGHYNFLSNFFPVLIKYDSHHYPTVENAYQAAKSISSLERLCFENCTPAQAKVRGQCVVLRPDWPKVKLKVMGELVYKKFQVPELKQRLLATGDMEIIEENTWNDTFWGICNGRGQNELGKILMAVRSMLRQAA